MTRETRTREALDAVLDWLLDLGIEAHELDGLELFAGDGNLQAAHYVDRLASIELWEIDGDRCSDLRTRFPHALIRQTNSIEALEAEGAGRRYDFVAVDNPLGLYGPDDRYCEHFEILPLLHRVLGNEAVVLLDVVPKPYDADRHPAWMARRSSFYGIDDVHELDMDFLISHYSDRFDRDGWLTKDTFAVCREYESGVDYFWYIAFMLQRNPASEIDDI